MIFKAPSALTIDTAYIAIIVLSSLVGIETAIICGLIKEVGSFGKLIRMALGITSASHKKTKREKDKPAD